MSRVVRSVLLLTVWTLGAGTAAGQLTGSNSPAPAGERPDSTRVGPMELLRGAGEAFTGLFRTDRAATGEPEWDSLEGPRAAVMTFVTAMDRVALGDEAALPRALKVLPDAADAERDGAEEREGADRDEVDQDAVDRAEAARDLWDVFTRLPEVVPATLPDAARCREEGITRWELFPRGIDSEWAYAALQDGAPAGTIVLEKTSAGWRFTPATVAGAGDLADNLAPIPPRPRKAVRGEAFVRAVTPVFTDSPWWAWLTTALGLAAGCVVAWFIARGLNAAAGWAAGGEGGALHRLAGGVIGPLLRSLAVPLGLAAVVAGLLAGTAPLALTPTLEDGRWAISELLLVVAGGWLAVGLLELAILGVRRAAFDDDDHYARMSASVARRTLRLIAGVILGLFVVQNLFDWNVTAVLGGVGLVALALSLAAKDAVANLFGGAMIFGTRPFLVGDWISFEGRWGEVADVSLQITKIRLLTGEMWAVPNSNFVDKPVENLSERKYLRRVFDVRLPLDTPPEKIAEAKSILQDVLTSDAVVGDGQGDLEERPPKVNFESVGEYFFNLRADYWYLMHPREAAPQRDTERGWFSYLAHCDLVNKAVVERFRGADIAFALPANVVYEAGEVAALTGAAAAVAE
ncbi:mechanosensitive ion channel domain-containing protein [Alienimonas sp. DA493]|uniref:mechanosensitive ion channel domain-containing protein n=1 Tax=Alienimonas sp. DA493 TaxID=3373605 RepID=UPI0037547584